MPTVPLYGGQKVNQSAVPSVRNNVSPSIESFGGGQAVQNVQSSTDALLNTTQRLFEKEREYANKQFVYEVRQKLNDYELNKIRGKDGLASRLGKNAFGVEDELAKDLSVFKENTLKEARNEEQKLLASELIDSRGVQFKRWAIGHRNTEIEKYEQANFQASLESSKERGSQLLEKSPQEKAFIVQLISDRADRLGIDGEAKQQMITEHVSDLHARGVNGLLKTGKYLEAKQYFESIKEDLDPDVSAKLKGALQEGTLRAESQAMEDEIFKKSTTLTQALETARSIEDPNVRDETVRRVKVRYQEERAAKEEQQTQMFNNALATLRETKNINSVPPNEFISMSKKRQKALKTLEGLYRQGVEPKTNPYTMYDLQQMASNPQTQGEFKKTNLTDYLYELSPSDFNKLSTIQSSLRKGTASKELGLIQTQSQMIRRTLESAKIEKGSDREKLFYDRVEKITTQMASDLSRNLTRDELQAVIDEQLMDVTIEDGGWFWFDKTVKAFEVPLENIPETEYIDIQNALRSKGYPSDESMVRRVYLRKLNAGNASAN